MTSLILAIVVAYLLGSALVTAATVGRPRRPFGLELSAALVTARIGLAVAVLGTLLALTPS